MKNPKKIQWKPCVMNDCHLIVVWQDAMILAKLIYR
jgi:hypothetical protein